MSLRTALLFRKMLSTAVLVSSTFSLCFLQMSYFGKMAISSQFPGEISKTGSETTYQTSGDQGSSAGQSEVWAGRRAGTQLACHGRRW